MKKLLFLLATVLITSAVINFTGCSKDNSSSPVAQTLVVVKRSNGLLFSVDKTTGDLTKIGALSYNGDSLRGLRCLVYDPATDKAYAGSTNDDNGYLYSVNLKTGVATLLNDNPDGNWDAISGILVGSGDSLITNMYSNIEGDGSALAKFSKTSGDYGLHRQFNDGSSSYWSIGGMIYGTSNSNLIIGGQNKIFLSDLNGLVTESIPLVQTANINDPDGVNVMAMAKDGDTVFGLLYESTEKNLYLVKVNTTAGTLTEVKLLVNGSNQTLYTCLSVIPENKLP